MNDDAALFAAALAHPDADTPRLVLADWFGDHGEDELAWALRTVPGIIPVLAELTRWDRMPAAPTHEFKNGHSVNRFESQYWVEFLVRYRDQFPEPPGVPVGYDPDTGWTTPDPPERIGPAGFLQAWQGSRRRSIAGLRATMAGIAAGWRNQPVALSAGDEPRAVEERALLLHELVLCGCGPGVIPGGARAWEALKAAGHPLFRLPDRLLGVESEHVLNSSPPLPARAVVESSAVVFSDRTPPPESSAWAAVRRWADESNGRLNGREFNLMAPHHADGEWTGWFRALPFVPLRQAATVAVVEPAAAFLALFSADRAGGAYSPPAGAAYPRLHAWESFGWLAGADPDAPCADVAALADRCRWYTFDGDWFYHVAWDLGLVCARPDGHSVAVLAATDTD
ncbi:TIGR02996 domain-containing protein [bacterium]|nr:TIGR02996 domain-containing protein [bacterium]